MIFTFICKLHHKLENSSCKVPSSAGTHWTGRIVYTKRIRKVSTVCKYFRRSGHIDNTPASHAGLLQLELRPGDRLS